MSVRRDDSSASGEIDVPEIYRNAPVLADWFREGYAHGLRGFSLPLIGLQNNSWEWKAFLEGYKQGTSSLKAK